MKRRVFLTGAMASGLLARQHVHSEFAMSDAAVLSDQDGSFLTDLKQRCYRFFVECAHPATGFVSDRASTDGASPSDHASSAACGFALSAHAIAADSNWSDRADAADRTRLLLRSLVEKAEHERGFVYHFFSTEDGRRMGNCEASSIDTALLIAGSMCASTTFADDTEIVQLADELYRRVDWRWMLGANDCMHMGWTPESGMIPHQWDSFSESVLLVLMAIGAPRSAIPPHCWQAWRREPMVRFQGREFMGYPPLFVHQYPMAYFDFRNLRSPSGRSYWRNAIDAHHAHVEFMDSLGKAYPQQFGHYSRDLWGLTSSDSEDGYRDWGGPFDHGRIEPDRGIDGTIVPSAAAGGLSIVPADAIRTLTYQRKKYGDSIYGRYGYVNAYNPATGWVGRDVIGIDTGITLLMAENLQSGKVWRRFMDHPAANRAVQLAGFVA